MIHRHKFILLMIQSINQLGKIYINPFGKSSENAVMTWQPTSTTDTGESYISGTLSLVYTGVKLTMSTTLYRSLSIGVVAATGNFTGTLGYNNSNSTFTGSRGQNDVIVNYYKKGTSTPVNSWTSSVIKANIADKVAVLAPGFIASGTKGVPSGTYNYVAPAAPTGYHFDSVSISVVVQNHDETSNPNENAQSDFSRC